MTRIQRALGLVCCANISVSLLSVHSVHLVTQRADCVAYPLRFSGRNISDKRLTCKWLLPASNPSGKSRSQTDKSILWLRHRLEHLLKKNYTRLSTSAVVILENDQFGDLLDGTQLNRQMNRLLSVLEADGQVICMSNCSDRSK